MPYTTYGSETASAIIVRTMNILIIRDLGMVHTIGRSIILGTNIGIREYMSVVRTERSCL